MVRAPKAQRLAQQAEHQVDAKALLERFDEKMQAGLPDEALRLASAAVDLFYKYGDKPGESRALSCVAQAMASGATLPRSEGTGAFTMSEPSSLVFQDDGMLASSREFVEGEDGIVEDNASSLALTDLSQLPISYGERLILETCMKSRLRPYDRQRQEALAQPRRRGGSAEAWGVKDGVGKDRSVPQGGSCGSTSRSAGPASTSGGVSEDAYPSSSLPPSKSSQEPRLSTDQEANLVNRLCQPRRRKADATKTPGEQIVLKNQERSEKLKSGAYDMTGMIARLSAPRVVRALSPSPGERVVLMWNRSENVRKPDLLRINELAKSSRRGATARAWGVFYAPNSGPAPMPPPSQPPASARAAPPAPMSMSSRPPDSARMPPRPRPAAQDVGPSNEGAPSPKSALPPLENAEDTTGYTTVHHWRKNGVDQHA